MCKLVFDNLCTNSLIVSPDWLTKWMADSLTHSLIHWPTHWLTDWLTHSLIHWPTHWLSDSLTHSLIHWPTHWLTDSLIHVPIDWLTDRMTGWLSDRLIVVVVWMELSAHRKNRRMWFLPFVTRDIKWSSPAKANKRFCLLAKQQENRQGLVTIKINRNVVMVVNSCGKNHTDIVIGSLSRIKNPDLCAATCWSMKADICFTQRYKPQ